MQNVKQAVIYFESLSPKSHNTTTLTIKTRKPSRSSLEDDSKKLVPHQEPVQIDQIALILELKENNQKLYRVLSRISRIGSIFNDFEIKDICKNYKTEFSSLNEKYKNHKRLTENKELRLKALEKSVLEIKENMKHALEQKMEVCWSCFLVFLFFIYVFLYKKLVY